MEQAPENVERQPDGEEKKATTAAAVTEAAASDAATTAAETIAPVAIAEATASTKGFTENFISLGPAVRSSGEDSGGKEKEETKEEKEERLQRKEETEEFFGRRKGIKPRIGKE